MDFKNTIFITDMDGTLLNKNKDIAKENIAAIDEYRAKGGIFGIATGRPIHTTKRYLDILNIDLPLILYNGCIIYDHKTESIIHATYLPDYARAILNDIFSRYPGIAPEIFTFEGQYYLNLNDAEKWHHEILKISYTKKSSGDEVAEPWCKLLFADSIEVIDELCEYVKKFDGMGVRFVRSCPYFLELLPENVSKGSALVEMFRLLKLSGIRVISAGDYDNDIEMLQASDISFCPANSEQPVKDCCNYVLKASCDEDAIAEAIKIIATI